MDHLRYFVLCALALSYLTVPAQGKLFIIGGGARPAPMLERLLAEAGLRHGDGYAMILPMASAEQDSAVWYAREQFRKLAFTNVFTTSCAPGERMTDARLDSIIQAKLIYITGGDQLRFMKSVEGTGVDEAIRNAYARGAIVAGTSAGAAVMSEQMITGNEKRRKEYSDTFDTIESDNIELASGLGLLRNTVIDQHFIRRSRYNRLLTLTLEFPTLTGIGIDEATAIFVNGSVAEVIGNSQVVVIENRQRLSSRYADKLGGKRLALHVYLPGEKFKIPSRKR